MSKWDVFLSYSSTDREKAECIYPDLTEAGVKVWFDAIVVTLGESIRQRVCEGIAASRILLVLISSHSLRSRWVLNELDTGMIYEIENARTFVAPGLDRPCSYYGCRQTWRFSSAVLPWMTPQRR
jgi:hypothetical protein